MARIYRRGKGPLVGHGPGVAKAEDVPPTWERTPNFIWITTGRFKIRMAPAPILTAQEEW